MLALRGPCLVGLVTACWGRAQQGALPSGLPRCSLPAKAETPALPLLSPLPPQAAPTRVPP